MAYRELNVFNGTGDPEVALIIDDEEVFSWCALKGHSTIKWCRTMLLVPGCNFDALPSVESFQASIVIESVTDLEEAVSRYLS